MTDFETHPVGTADLLDRMLNWQPYADEDVIIEEAAAQVKQLESALTRANAATAAAFEVAAGKGLSAVNECRDMEETDLRSVREYVASAIRALATPDQTAALDRLISEAEARVWKQAAEIAYDHTPEKHGGATLAAHVNGRNIEAAILAASKKGGV